MGEKDGENRSYPASKDVRHPVQQVHRAAGNPVLMDLVDRARQGCEKNGVQDGPHRGESGLPPP